VGLGDLVELRCALEAAALRLAAGRAEPGRLEEARAALDEMRAPELSIEDFDRADVRFHVALARASGNEAMHLLMLTLRHAVARHLLDALRSQRDPRRTLRRLAREHEAILGAVAAGEGDRAATLVEDHIRGFYRSVQEG
jgi:GntR family transcriptional repressor for pyruvate dehydrogenase complex